MKTSDDELAVRKVSEELLDAAVLTESALVHFEDIIVSEPSDSFAAAVILALKSAHNVMSKASDDLTKVVGE
jgi:hypothetical protein